MLHRYALRTLIGAGVLILLAGPGAYATPSVGILNETEASAIINLPDTAVLAQTEQDSSSSSGSDDSGSGSGSDDSGSSSGSDDGDGDGDEGGSSKVTICHATSSNKNPYTTTTVNASGLNGHDGHTGPTWTPETRTWGDIIPPTRNYPGLNYDTYGQTILENNCTTPEQNPGAYLTPHTTCWRYDQENEAYQVLMSYTNKAPYPFTVNHGKDNNITPKTLPQNSPETLNPGYVFQGYVITIPHQLNHEQQRNPQTVNQTLATWNLVDKTADFNPHDTSTCGPDVIVPAEGNGTGWIIVMLAAGVIAGGPLVLKINQNAKAYPQNNNKAKNTGYYN